MTISEAKQMLAATAKGELGYREGGNNYTKYAADPMITKLYGWTPQNQPWCCTFVNWCFLQTFGYDIGSRLTFGGTAACSASADLFRQNDAFVHFPEVGDQAFYFSGGGINHTGIVVSVEGTSFTAIEGNYSDKVSSVRHNIGKGDVAGFGRPDWKIVGTAHVNPDQPKEDTKPQKQDEESHEWNPQLLQYSNAYKADCVVLQALLNAHHFPCGSADGFFGAKTQNAVFKAQEYYKIEKDGICGKQTWKHLLQMN